jgi:hypothetical protein
MPMSYRRPLFGNRRLASAFGACRSSSTADRSWLVVAGHRHRIRYSSAVMPRPGSVIARYAALVVVGVGSPHCCCCWALVVGCWLLLLLLLPVAVVVNSCYVVIRAHGLPAPRSRRSQHRRAQPHASFWCMLSIVKYPRPTLRPSTCVPPDLAIQA